jgi:Intron-binding protein aquarius N-terminus
MQINADPLSQIATANWSAAALGSEQPPTFQPELVQQIYNEHLGGAAGQPPGLRKVMLLEISQYLENYLWPNFAAATATPQHVLSILLMVNEKFRENVPAWDCFDAAPVGAKFAIVPHAGLLVCQTGSRRLLAVSALLWSCPLSAVCRWRLRRPLRRGTRGSRKQRGSRRSASRACSSACSSCARSQRRTRCSRRCATLQQYAAAGNLTPRRCYARCSSCAAFNRLQRCEMLWLGLPLARTHVWSQAWR